MKTTLSICMFAAVLLAGCASQSQQRFAQFEVALTATVDALGDLRMAGMIDDDEYRALAPFVEKVYEAREKAAEALESGDEVSLDFWLDKARELLRELQAKEIALQPLENDDG